MKITKTQLTAKEKGALIKGSKDVSISIDKKDIESINLLIANNYEITSIDETKYTLLKSLAHNKTFRISLTEQCNYQCFFCHEEGLEMGKKWNSKSIDDIYKLCKRAISNGYTDLTFTGGEPLIKWRDVVEILKRLKQDDTTIDISIVTNAQLINDELLEAIANYPGKTKFNISVHHTNADQYHEITIPKNKKNNFGLVKANIQKIVERGIYTKLNFVVLRDVNTSLNDLNEIITFGEQLGVNRIKFLELLITDKLIEFYKYHYSLKAIEQSIEDRLELIKKDERTRVFSIKDSKLELELSKVPCSMGCDSCVLSSGLILTSELEYHPCFFRSSVGLDMSNAESFLKNEKEGNLLRFDFGNKYKDKTPFVINDRANLKTKKEYQYTTSNKQNFIDNLTKEGFEMVRLREFNEIHLDSKVENVFMKLYKNTYNKNYIEITKESYSVDGSNVIFTRFLSENQNEILDLDKYINKLKIIGGKVLFEVDWKIGTYKKDNEYVSVSTNSYNSETVILATSNIRFIDVKPLNKPLEKYLLDQIGSINNK